MSFFKKLGETVKDTASSIGSKSADLVETGKLKLQRNQLENSIKEKKTEIGDLVFKAYQGNGTFELDILTPIFAEIQDLEKQIEAVDEKLHKETVQGGEPPVYSQNASTDGPQDSSEVIFCSNCGQQLAANAKFCNKCGSPQ